MYIRQDYEFYILLHCLFILPVLGWVCNAPSTGKLKLRMTFLSFAIINNLYRKENPLYSATKHCHHLTFVAHINYFHPLRTLFLHRPCRERKNLYHCLALILSGGISFIWTVVITSWINSFYTLEKFFTACLLLDSVGFLGTKSILLKREWAQCWFKSILPPYSTSLYRLYASNRPLAAAIAIVAITGPPLARNFFKYYWSFLFMSSPSKTVLPCFFYGFLIKILSSPFFFSYLLALETPSWLILPCFHLLNALASWRNDKLLQQH